MTGFGSRATAAEGAHTRLQADRSVLRRWARMAGVSLTVALSLGIAGLAGIASTTVASAQTPTASVLYVANGGNDGGGANTCQSQSAPCATLSQALSQAPAGATIYVTGTIDEAGTASISEPVTIIGSPTTSAGPAVIDDSGNGSVIDVTTAVTVTLDDLTITGGVHSDGGIFNGGTLNITDSTVTGNRAPAGAGGGIDNFGTLNITDSTVTGNGAGAYGGGIANEGVGTLNITDSTVTGNGAGVYGGGIANEGGTLNITDSTVTGNGAVNGGGIDNGGTLTVTNSTVADNGTGAGGGIDNHAGTLHFGGSVFAGNGCLLGWNADAGGNVTDPSSSSCALGSDVTAMNDGDLGPLAYNGGPTETIALLPGNPAIGVVTSGCPAADQRGMPRPSTSCDAGAYQTGTFSASLAATPASQVIAPSATATVTATLDIASQPAPAGFPVELAVTSGPDSGQTATAVTTSAGTATFSVTSGGTPGTDVVSVTSPIAPGTTPPGLVSPTSVDVVVGAAPEITSPATAYFPWLGADTTFHLQATGTPAPTLTLSGTLPQGLSFDPATATIAGTAGVFSLGSHEVTLTASNGIGAPAVQTLDIVVGVAPYLFARRSASFITGRPGDLRLFAFAYPTATITETGALPSGVSFVDNANGTAAISGTPDAGSTGSYPITVTATNPFGSSTATVTLNVRGPERHKQTGR